MSQVSALLKEAEMSMESGNYDEAIQKFQAVKEEAEPSPELFAKLAQAFALRGRYLTVLSVYLEWAQNALERNELEQAGAAVGYALALRPDSPEAHLMRVKVSRAAEQKEQLLEQLLELSYLYLEKGQGEESVPLMQEAIELCPENLDLPLKLAEVYVSVGQIGLAVTGYRRSVNLFLDAGEPAKTVDPLKRLRMLKPDDIGVMLELGKMCLALGRLDEAEEQFRSILKIDLEHEEALLSLASVCESKGKFRNGILAVNKVLQLNPKSAVGLQRMGELQRASGDFEKAVDAYRTAAQLYLEEGKKLEAGEAFQAILWMDEHDSAAQMGLHSLGIEPIPEEPDMPKAEKIVPVVEETEPEVVEAPIVTDEIVTDEEEKIAPAQRFTARPRLVKKEEYKEKTSSPGPTFQRGLRLKPGLRNAMGPRSDGSPDKPFFPPREKKEVAIVASVEAEPEVPELEFEEPELIAPDELFPESSETLEKGSEPEQGPMVVEASQIAEVAPEIEVPELELEENAYEGLFEKEEPEIESTAKVHEPEIDEEEAEVLSIFNWPDEDWMESDDEDVFTAPSRAEVEATEVALIEPSERAMPAPMSEQPEETEFDFDLDFDLDFEASQKSEAQEIQVEQSELVEEPKRPESTVDADVLFPLDAEPAGSIFDGFEGWDLDPVSEPPEESPVQIAEVDTASEWTMQTDRIEEEETIPVVEEEVLVETFESFESEDEPAQAVEEIDTGVLFPEPVVLEDSVLVVEDVEVETPELDFPEPIEIPLPTEVESCEVEEVAQTSYDDLLEAERVKLVEEKEPEDSQDLADILAQTLPLPVTPIEETEVEVEPEPELDVEVAGEPLTLPDVVEVLEEVPVEKDDVPQDAGDAIVYYREALAHAPADEDLILKLADYCLQFGLIPEALEHYRNLQRVNPGSVEVGQRLIKAALWMEDYETVSSTLLKVAQLQFAKGELVGCQDHLGDLLSLEPDHKEARQLMVEVFLASEQEKLAAWHLSQMVERWASEGEWEAATQALMRLGQIAPSDTVKERLALLYQKQGEDAQALALFRELRDRYESAGDLKRAEDVAYRILRSEASVAEDRRSLVILLEKQELWEEAAEEKFLLARELRSEGALDEASSVLQELNRNDSLEAEQLLVEIYLEGGKLNLAEHHAESLAERFLEKKAYKQAISLFESWTKAEPLSAKTRERLAQFYQLGGDINGAKLEWLLVTGTHEAQGDFDRAVRALERALELDPEQWEWRLRLARLKWNNLANAEGALAELRQIFSRRPDWTDATELLVEVLSAQNKMSELGEVLTRLGDSDLGMRLKAETMESLKTKLQTRTDDFELQFAWGELCYGLGSLDLAIEQFQKLRRQPEYRLRSYRLLGHCFSKKKGFNMTELALSQFRKGLALPDESEVDMAEIRCDMARLLISKGRLEEAKEQVQLARPWLKNTREVDKLLGACQGE